VNVGGRLGVGGGGVNVSPPAAVIGVEVVRRLPEDDRAATVGRVRVNGGRRRG
jgi:hypothetical protein